MSNTSQYRITSHILAEIYENSQFVDYLIYPMQHGRKQYIYQTGLNDSVLDDKKTINKLYFNAPIWADTSTTTSVESQVIRFLFRENFEWNEGVFGVLLSVKDLTTNNVLLNEIIQYSELKTSSELLRIDGSFWPCYVQFSIPKIKQSNLSVSAVTIRYEDIDVGTVINPGSGIIYNYPTEYIPLISSYPTPDMIQLSSFIDENLFIGFGIITTENKTVEKSLLEYFNETSDNNISIEYLVEWGNDSIGYKSLTISNNANKYGGIKILPDYQPNETVNVLITMTVRIDEKIMQRQVTAGVVNTSYLNKLSQLNDIEINHFVVEHVEKTIVENDIIVQQETKPEVIVINQPVYIRHIDTDNDIKLDASNRLITFDEIKNEENTHLVFYSNETNQVLSLLYPLLTVNGVYYFDCTLVDFDAGIDRYQLIDNETNTIIKKGKIEH